MARNPLISAEIENGILTIRTEGHPAITVDPANMPDDLNAYAALHGYKQRIVDAAAKGPDATPAEKHAAMQAVYDHMFKTGEWSRVGQGGEGTGGDGLLVKAIMEATGVTRDVARTAVAGMNKPTQHAMRQSAELKPIIDRLRMARAPKPKAGLDVAGMLASIGRA